MEPKTEDEIFPVSKNSSDIPAGVEAGNAGRLCTKNLGVHQ